MYPQRPLSYAPTPYSYTPNPALSASINLDEVCPYIPCCDDWSPTHCRCRKSSLPRAPRSGIFTSPWPRSTASS